MLLWCIAIGYFSVGMVMMLVASPKVPYADPWRFLTTLLERPFPENILVADNGHREVLPNLVRLADLLWFSANQWLQVLVGMALAIATTIYLLRSLRSDSPTERAASAAVVAIGVFWLGNSRKLSHGTESIHLFMILPCLIGGLRVLANHHAYRGLCAGLLALLASVTFGSGAACFAAFLVVMWLRRDSWRQVAALLLVAVVAALALMADNHGVMGTERLEIMHHVEQLLCWLGAPFVWVLSPLLDAGHADRMPWQPLRMMFGPIARTAEAVFGPALTARWPALLFGAVGFCWLLWQSFRERRRGEAQPTRLLALGLAWFGVGVGVLVVVARCRYFVQHRDQIVAQRYLSWSMLLWTGLLLTYIQNAAGRGRFKFWLVIAAAVLFAPSQIWTARYAFQRQLAGKQTAVAAAVEVIDVNFDMVETTKHDLLRAMPRLRDAQKSVWAWPAVQLLDKPAPKTPRLVVTDLQVQPVRNLFARPGCEVHFTSDAQQELLLLVDPSGFVVGLATRDQRARQWIGWLRGTLTADELTVQSP
jgi:lambda repressor-like predicted transcriptional regulator